MLAVLFGYLGGGGGGYGVPIGPGGSRLRAAQDREPAVGLRGEQAPDSPPNHLD